MPSTTADSVHIEEIRAELQSILHSQSFTRSPGLSRLLSYLCDKVLAGESNQIKEHSVALDVFGRQDTFDQDSDSIVRVQANRLRKRLAEYYESEGKAHKIRITIPVGQYVPVFEEHEAAGSVPENHAAHRLPGRGLKGWMWLTALAGMIVLGALFLLAAKGIQAMRFAGISPSPESATPTVGLPVGDEIRILAGANRSYVDRSGKLWNPDTYFSGGTVIRSSVQHIWRTQDPAIYRTSRQGDFKYEVPLKPGIYELRLHYAETYYGPEDVGGGGEGSRVMTIAANGQPLLDGLDVLPTLGAARTADVKVFTDNNSGKRRGPASEFLVDQRARNGVGNRDPAWLPRAHATGPHCGSGCPYYSNDSQWWSSDMYFKGGQMAASEDPASGTTPRSFTRPNDGATSPMRFPSLQENTA